MNKLVFLTNIYIAVFSVTPGYIRTALDHIMVPPLIVNGPTVDELVFRTGELFRLPCHATANPQPNYLWKRNSYPLPLNSGNLVLESGSGNLQFLRPTRRDEGIYQCIAQNIAGIAVSRLVHVREAVLGTFIPAPVVNKRVAPGRSLTLDCIPPKSIPKAEIFWAVKSTGGSIRPLYTDNRITMDLEGRLHFVNVLRSDSISGTYVCVAQNSVIRGIQQGSFARVIAHGSVIRNIPVSLMWSSPRHHIVLRGDTWKGKCIFSGSPTPRVQWARIGKDLTTRHRLESYGQTLLIENVQFEDAGTYQCSGINDVSQVPIRRDFQIKVESKPYWTKPLKPVIVSKGDTAVFYNEESMYDYHWIINGIIVSNETVTNFSPRLIISDRKLTFYDVKEDDDAVVQCNITNRHGYSLSSAYLNVFSEAATIIKQPTSRHKASEGQTVQFTCEAFGLPVPKLVWRKGNDVLTGGRFTVLQNGSLQISEIRLADTGIYTCNASNKLGTDKAVTSLIVRRRTKILKKPADQTVTAGSHVTFNCSAITDIHEAMNLTIQWTRDDKFINFELSSRVYKNELVDDSLHIFYVIPLDSGKYTCVASNGIDYAKAEAKLVVQAVPNEPYRVNAVCNSPQFGYAKVTWTAGKENNSPVKVYIVQYNTTNYKWTDIAQVTQYLREVDIKLTLWGNYTFRVLAVNDIGRSWPSYPARTVCRVAPGRPQMNPHNVSGQADTPNHLVISWKPMTKQQQNGEGFSYFISWKRADIKNAVQQLYVENNPRAWYHVVKLGLDIPPYTPYNISVKARNFLGESTALLNEMMGHSGESEPTVSPQDIRIVNGSVTNTTAKIKWTSIPTKQSDINGYFVGYRIQFARVNDWPNNIIEQDIEINTPTPHTRPRVKRQIPETVVTVENLPPNSDVKLQVRVLNKYYTGPVSNVIVFTTLDGVPEPPYTLDITEIGSSHFQLIWQPPQQSNGHITGYRISYEIITGLNLSDIYHKANIISPTSMTVNLTGLNPETKYRVYLSAVSNIGSGEPNFMDMVTATDKYIPRNTLIQDGNNNPIIKSGHLLYINETITCTTDSYPAPYSYEWLNVSSGKIIGITQQLKINETTWLGNTNLMCRVRNILKVNDYQPDTIGEENITVIVNITVIKVAEQISSPLEEGTIAGIVVAVVVLLFIVIVIIVLIVLHRKRKQRKESLPNIHEDVHMKQEFQLQAPKYKVDSGLQHQHSTSQESINTQSPSNNSEASTAPHTEQNPQYHTEQPSDVTTQATNLDNYT